MQISRMSCRLAWCSWYCAVVFLAAAAMRADEGALGRAQKALAGGQWEAAVTLVRPLAAEGQSAKTRLAALESLSVALAGLGRQEESARAAQWAERLFGEQEKVRLAKANGYSRNRSVLDRVPTHAIGLLRKRREAAAKAGNEEQAMALSRLLACRFPTHPERRLFALEAGERAAALGDRGEAVAWFLAALDTGLDRCFVGKAKLRENQVQLDAVAKPPPLELVERALAGLTGVAAPLVAKRYHAALARTRSPDDEEAAKAVRRLLRKPLPEGQFFAEAAMLELARTHLRCGHVPEAREVLEAIATAGEDVGVAAVVAQREFLLGVVESAELDQGKAAEHFARAAVSGGDALAEQAHYEHARSLELAWRWSDAATAYRAIAKDGVADVYRRGATVALSRLPAFARATPPDRDAPVVLLPDDRETQGDWYLDYGGEAFGFSGQRRFSSRNSLEMKLSTGNPKETVRGWTSARNSADQAALWCPTDRSHVASNHDDFGGHHPLGDGPDLVADLSIPEGDHILAFYFANDSQYYENSRRYTMEVRAGDRLVAVTDVRDFGGGVYKRLLVRGPHWVRVRIRRDASLNTLLQGVFLSPLPSFDPSPLAPEAESGKARGTYGKFARRLKRRPANLASVAPLVAFSDSLVGKESLSPAEQQYRRSRLLSAAGRPRSAYRAFRSFTSAIPTEELFGAAEVVAKRMQEAAGKTVLPVDCWPEDAYPVEVLNERWFAYHYPLVDPPDEERLAALADLVSGKAPQATGGTCKRALDELSEHAPERLTEPVLWSGSRLFHSRFDCVSAAALLHRLLAKTRDRHWETRAVFELLNIAHSAKLSVAEVEALSARALALVKLPGQERRRESAHLFSAQAFAAYGKYEKAIALLEAVPGNLTDRRAEEYRKKLAEERKGRKK